jgi:hypothetical protein
MQRKKNFLLFKFILLFLCNIGLYNVIHLSALTDCKDIFQFLYQNSGLKDLLQENIFNIYGARGINYRSVVTTPIGLYYNQTDSLFNNFSIAFLYLNTPNGVLFGENNNLSALINTRSLVDLYSQKISNFLEDTPYLSFNAPFFGQSFHYINIIQNRFAFMVQGAFELSNRFFLYGQLPFIYNIYYPSIPSEIQAMISMEITQFGFNQKELEAGNNSIKKNTSRDVIINHSVYDTFGLDKSVIGIGSKWCDEMINTELRLLLPGRDIFQNSIGGDYEKAKNKISSLQLKNLLINIIDGTGNNKIDINDLKSKILTGFDRVVLGSYYNPLSYQTLGISPSMIFHIPCNNKIFIDAYLTYIYNFSQEVIGCGMRKYNNQFDRVIDFENLSEVNACKDLDSFTKILESKLIPELYEGTLSNGAEYQAALCIRSTVSDMSVGLGTDFWYCAQSVFMPINPNKLLINTINPAMQWNGFFNFEYYIDFCSMPLTISCFFQATVFSKGIGKEYGGKLQLSMQY